MPLLVLCATARELSSALGSEWVHAQGGVVPTQIQGSEVLAAATGVGVINASLVLGRALARGNVEGVLCLGVAGSFDLAEHPLGSVRLVEEETWPEYGLLASGWSSADAGALGFPLGRLGERRVWDRVAWDAEADLLRLGLNSTGLERVKSLTVSGVSADPERAGALHHRHPAALENMEGFALAYGCALAGLPFAEVRTVSNAVGSRPPRDWDLPGALGALGRATAELFAPRG